MNDISFSVIVADDQPFYLKGFCSALEKRGDCKQIITAVNGEQLIRAALESKPQLILVDIIMPIINGIQATRVLKEEMPEVKIVGLALYQPERLIEKFMAAGADGYLFKNCDAVTFNEAIEEVMYKTGKYCQLNNTDQNNEQTFMGLELF
jgi:two-component system nitrate/nitrite response regulator NarL